MQTGLVHIHNLLRWIILILLVVSIYKAYTGWKSGAEFKASDKKTWLFTMIAAHITLLLGLYQVAFGRYGIFSTTLPEGTSFMKDKFYRFYWLEHPLLMIIAITLITVGHATAKKNIPAEQKYKKAFVVFLIALIAILAAIPWPFREVVGRHLLPGM
ncbi:MAG: hypothetical protein K2X26_11370 [Chitinophagaceae bacterium]|nr:hypothetical protein [Chitinophagaceae bacterium]